MDVSEKLVELFYDNNVRCDQKIEGLADDVIYIIDHGVMVQEWISVDDRLPEKDGEYLVWFGKRVFKQYAKVLSFAKDGETVDKYDLCNEKNVWFYDDSECGYIACRDVTHWMPIPRPPKGE